LTFQGVRFFILGGARLTISALRLPVIASYYYQYYWFSPRIKKKDVLSISKTKDEEKFIAVG